MGVAVQTIYARLGSKHGMPTAIGALFAAAAVEPDLADAVAEGRRHRDDARITVERIAELGGLREHLPAVQARSPAERRHDT